MPEGAPIYEPINGREARQILIHDATEKINGITRFKEGAAFHRLHMIYTMVCTCFPADCPVPTMEYEIARSAPGFNEQKDYIEKTEKIKALLAKKIELEKGIDRINAILSVIQPIVEVEENLIAGDTPDILRVDHGLPVPRLIRSTNDDGMMTSAEKYVQVEKI